MQACGSGASYLAPALLLPGGDSRRVGVVGHWWGGGESRRHRRDASRGSRAKTEEQRRGRQRREKSGNGSGSGAGLRASEPAAIRPRHSRRTTHTACVPRRGARRARPMTSCPSPPPRPRHGMLRPRAAGHVYMRSKDDIVGYRSTPACLSLLSPRSPLRFTLRGITAEGGKACLGFFARRQGRGDSGIGGRYNRLLENAQAQLPLSTAGPPVK